VPYSKTAITSTLRELWRDGKQVRLRATSSYARPNTAKRIASILVVGSAHKPFTNKLIWF
jgi:hypothetical protein